MNETKTQVGQIRTEVHGHVFKIIIDNVAKKNSFSPQMMAQMSDAMTLLDRTDDYWVGVLCAEGPDFTAGLDMPKFFGPKAENTEIKPRYVMLVKIANKDTESVVSALIKQSLRLPSELYRSLTWDRGKELADHQRLTLATEVKVYFCDPRSPWQRGSNENTNRLLRQYLPRGTDLSLHSQTKLSAIARQLNERPRKTLLYQTPAEKFAECVAAIS